MGDSGDNGERRRASDTPAGRARAIGGMSAVGGMSMILGILVGMSQLAPLTPWMQAERIDAASKAATEAKEAVTELAKVVQAHVANNHKPPHELQAKTLALEERMTLHDGVVQRDISEIKTNLRSLRGEAREDLQAFQNEIRAELRALRERR